MNATELTASRPGWVPVLRDHVRTHRAAAIALAVALLAALALLAPGLIGNDASASGLRYALLGGSIGFISTAIGAAPALAVMVATATGLLEPLGALLGIALASGFALAYPIGLGLAAGAMIFVVSHEVIPQTHRNGHQTPATVGLMLGFALMMSLNTLLG